VVGDRTDRGGSHGQFVFGIDHGFVIEGKAHGHESAGRGRFPINKLAHLYIIRYSVLYKVHDAGRSGAAENPADLYTAPRREASPCGNG
jgi:hypothetical protein